VTGRHCEEIVMANTARSRHPDAPWLVVVLAAVCTGLHIWDLPAAIPFIRDQLSVTLLQAGALLGVTQAAGMLQWMTVVGFLPTIYAGSGLTGIWPGLLSAVVGGVSAIGSIGTAPLLQRGIPDRALLIGGFAAMAATSLLTFAIHWASLPAGLIFRVACVSAFSLLGGTIPAALFRIAVDLAPPAGSAPAVIGLMQQIFNAGSVAGPAIAAWLVTYAGGWQSTWWMTCAFAALGSLLSLHLAGSRLGIASGTRRRDQVNTSEATASHTEEISKIL
jgi:predicted MFS family arabinose efflux permease